MLQDPNSIKAFKKSKEIIALRKFCKISDLIVGAPTTLQEGRPGAGKTSIINFLAKRGYYVVPEAATEIIEEGLRVNIERPWKAEDYHIRMYELITIRKLEVQNSSAPIAFFDRGHLDGISYILLQNRTLYKYILDCVQSTIDTQYFNKRVFFIENLDFVVPGPARDEDLQESLQKAHCLKQNYLAMGYEIVHIPPGPVEWRAQMIIDSIAKWDEEQQKSNQLMIYGN